MHEVGFIGNLILQTETENRPHISLGTSSDRIGTPEGPKSYYATFAKALPGVAPYVSINYSEFEDGFNFPFGASFALNSTFDLLAMNDGRKSHLLLTYKQPSYNLSLMWIWLRRPGISVSFGF